MTKKRIVSLLLALSLVFCLFATGCSSDKEDDKKEDTTKSSSVESNDASSDKTKGEMPTGYVSKYKCYEMRIGEVFDTTYIRYREGSEFVAEFTGACGYTAPYKDAILGMIEPIKESIDALNSPDVQLTYLEDASGGIKINFAFTNLDKPLSAEAVEAIETFMGVTANEDGTFSIESCEAQFAANGFQLIDNN